MMPKVNGITVLKRIRQGGSSIPILLLTAKIEIDDRVLGLDRGAEDYLTKPFATKELQLLEMMMTNSGQLISTERFMEKIWGFDSDVELNVVWLYISYLRKKLSAIGEDVQIRVSRNIGYSLEVKP